MSVELLRKKITRALLILFAPILQYIHILFEDKNFEKLFGIQIKIDTSLTYWIFILVSISVLVAIFFVNSKGLVRLGLYSILSWVVVIFYVTLTNMAYEESILIKLIAYALFVFWFFSKKRHSLSKEWRVASVKYKLTFIFFFTFPLANYTSYLIPSYQSVSLFFFEVTDYGFGDIKTLFFYLIFKISLIVFFMIWFFYEKRWFRYAILSPILITSNQILNTFNSDDDFIDEIEISQSGPYLLLLALFLILLAKLVDNQERIRLVLEERYSQLEQLVEERLKKRQAQIESNRRKISSNNLKTEELQKLKKKLEKELKNID